MITVDEDLTKYLHSLLQVEMTGSSIFDYIHQGDHVEIAEQLGLSLSSQSQPSSGMTSPSSNDEPTGTHNPHGEFLMCSSDYRAVFRKVVKTLNRLMTDSS